MIRVSGKEPPGSHRILVPHDPIHSGVSVVSAHDGRQQSYHSDGLRRPGQDPGVTLAGGARTRVCVILAMESE